MSDSNQQYRNLDEWYRLITECRQSGMTDEQWCTLNGIKRYTFYSAIKRLRQKAYATPKPERFSHDDIHDITCQGQDVVKVDIVSDIQPPVEPNVPVVASHIDNSHTIEIKLGRASICLSNDADPVLLAKAIKIIGGLS